MLYAGMKKDALEIHKKAVEKYNAVYETVQKRCDSLYTKRKTSIVLIDQITELINSIANSPREFGAKLVRIKEEQIKFSQTEEYAVEAAKANVKSGVSVAAGVAAGTAVSAFAPTAAMWTATTFGTASTGTAISALAGAAQTKAALAWLGGGAKAVGGAGIVGGKAFLNLLGPIGWSITSASTAASVAFLGHKNKKISSQAVEEAKEITIAGAQLNEAEAEISNLIRETDSLLENLAKEHRAVITLHGANYAELPEEDQLHLGILVNTTLALAEMLNKTVD